METVSRIVLTFLLNSLWQVSLIAAVAWAACRMMRHGPARHRYAVWAAALLASLALPLASLRGPAQSGSLHFDASLAGTAAPASSAAAPQSLAQHARQPRATVSLAGATAAVLLSAYGLFLLFQLLRLGIAWRRTLRIRSNAGQADLNESVRRTWDRCRAAFGIEDAALLFSHNICVPVAAGRSIILPARFADAGTEDELVTAIGHEMAHLARRDFGWNLLFELAQFPIAYHPAAWLMRRGIEHSREMACDELVTARLLAPSVYARSIMSIAAASLALPSPGCTLGVFDGNILEERIRRLIEGRAANLKRARLLCAAALTGVAACAVIASGLAISARAQSSAQSQMDAAKAAREAGDAAANLQHLRNAVALDPKNLQAHILLGDALMSGTMPLTGEAAANEIRAQFQDALAVDPASEPALKGMMLVEVNTKHFDAGRSWALKLIAAHPRNADAYYTVGFIDWVTVYPAVQQARRGLGMQPQDRNYIADAAVRGQLRDQYMPLLEDGFRMLQIALQIDPQYSDAMAYMNLLFRLKANLMDTPADSDAATAQADEWVHKALAARKATPARPSAMQELQAPPPPPPPPPPPGYDANQPASAAPPAPRLNPAEAGNLWQVVGTPGLSAKELVKQLQTKGFPAIVGRSPDNLVRVFAGPYTTSEALTQAKTALQAAGFTPLRTW